jgi:hypothetical protein
VRKDIDLVHLYSSQSINLISPLFVEYKYLLFSDDKSSNRLLEELHRLYGYKRNTRIGRCPQVTYMYAQEICHAKNGRINRHAPNKCEKFLYFIEPEYDLDKMTEKFKSMRIKNQHSR